MKIKHTKQFEILSGIEGSELITPRIDLSSNKEAFIDGCMGIIEYNNETVRLNCKNLLLKINGSELTIKANSVEQITVTGNILSIDFTDM